MTFVSHSSGDRQFILTAILLLLFTSPLSLSAVVIYVDHSTDNTDCTNTSSNRPCNNLSASLELILGKDDSMLKITSGTYTLPNETNLIYKSMTNVTFKAIEVKIICMGIGNGIAFVLCQKINIEGITFSGCGIKRNSTSRDNNLSLLPVMTALYFINCRTVSLKYVTIHQSVALAVQFYSTTGKVEILNSNFIDNVPNDGMWGGGVYIEFPFCEPGDESCDNETTSSSVDISSVSNSEYIIKGCVFQRNEAADTSIRFMVLGFRSNHRAPGRGGGLSVFFKGNASNNRFVIENCIFEGNHATYGGGIYMQMLDSAQNNSISLVNSNFSENYAKSQGGGLLVSFLYLKDLTGDEVNSGNVELQNVTFTKNSVGTNNSSQLGKGGGISYVTTRQATDDMFTANKFSMTNCVFEENFASIGSAIKVSTYGIQTSGHLYPVNLINVSLMGNYVENKNINRPLGSGALYVSHVPIIFEGLINFIKNLDGTGLVSFNSKIIASSNANIWFKNNTGNDGGAMALRSSSVLVIGDNVTFYFHWNNAFNRGGAIFADYIGPTIDFETQNCFIQYHDFNVSPSEWNAKFEFLENSVGEPLRNNSIYASSLYPCILDMPFGIIDDENELLKNVFCWNNMIWDYNGQECSKEIDTELRSFDPISSPVRLSVIPGKVTAMNLSGIDDQGDFINSNFIVHAYTGDTNDGVSVNPDYKYISNNRIRLQNRNKVHNATIRINTIGQETTMQTELIVEFQNCTPGLQLNLEGECICNGSFGGVLKCDDSNLTASLLRGYWIGYAPCDYDNRDVIVVAHCKYCTFTSVEDGYFKLDKGLDEIQHDLCGDKRNGSLCSECTEGNLPAINLDKYQCVDCDKTQKIKGGFMFLGLDVLLPIMAILFLLVADVPLTDGILNGPIFFAQMITTVISLDADDIIQYQNIVGNFSEIFEKFYTNLYDVFNMEFLMSLQNYCIGLPHYADVIVLHYVTAFLPMSFVLVVGFFINCFDRISKTSTETRLKIWAQSRLTNLSNILATCILLAYTKVAILTCYLLTPISLVNRLGTFGDYKHSVLYVDGSVCFPSIDYRTGIAIAVTVFFLIPTPIFLAIFRYKETIHYNGFFNNLLLQFQKSFRQSKKDFESLRDKNCGRMGMNGKKKESIFCDPLKCGEKKILDNRTECEYECCSPNYLCRYYQKRSKIPIVINTSCSLYDHRWLCGGFFVLRIAMILPFTVAWTTIIRYCIQLTICMFAAIIVLIAKPYKRGLYSFVDCNRVEAFSYLNLAFILSLCIYQFHYSTTNGLNLSLWAYIIQCVLVMVPFVWILCVYVYLVGQRHKTKLRSWFGFCCRMPDRVGRWHNLAGYDPLGEDGEGSESIPLSERSYASNVAVDSSTERSRL